MSNHLDYIELIVFLMTGLLFMLGGSINSKYKHQDIIVPVENLKFNFMTGYGVFTGLISGLLFGLFEGAIKGLIYGLGSGLIYGLIFGMIGEEIKNRNSPNQGIKESAKNAFIFTLIVLPLLILFRLSILYLQGASINVFDLLQFGLRLALLFGILFAGIPVIQHFSLRLILWKNGSIPWNYARFLKYADERKLINQVGGRFTFIHDKLQEHFANM